MTVRLTAELADLVDRQRGVVSRGQLRSAGISRHHVRNQVLAGRWVPRGPRVVATFTGQLTREQRWQAAVLHAGPRAALAGLSAALAHGLTGWPSSQLHVLVPHHTHVPPLAGLRVHQSRLPVVRDAHGRSPAPVAVWDAATWAATDSAAAGLLAAGVQQRLVLPDGLLAVGQRWPRRRELLTAVCADLVGGAQALSEIRLGWLARRAGLPAPVRQAVRVDAAGRRRYLDADFGSFAVEIEGMPHLGADSQARDLLRVNDLVLTDLRLLRFAAWTVRAQPDIVVAQLRRAACRWR